MQVKEENSHRRYSDVGVKRPAVDFIDLTPTKRPKIENILVTSGEQLGEHFKLKKRFVLDPALSKLPIGRYLSQVPCTMKDMSWLESEMRGQSNLTCLDLRGLQLAMALRLLTIVTANKNIDVLRVSYVNEEVAYRIAQILQVEQLEILDLSCCYIKPSIMASVTTPLSGYKRLKFLDLSHNEIGSEGFNALGLVLKNNLSLQTLLVSDVAQEDYSWQTFAEGLHAAQCLTRLDISYNPLSPNNALLLVNSLAANRTIEDLNMEAMSLRGIEAERLTGALSRNSNLTKLNVSRNPQLGIDGARAIAQLISLNKLKDLDVSLNTFTNTSIAAIATSLQQNKSLVHLSLAGNRFDATALKTLFGALANQNQMRSLNLRQVKFPLETFANVQFTEIWKNKSLTDIDARDGPDSLKNLFNAVVTRNKKIKNLDLSSLHALIELKDWTKVEDFFRANPSMKLTDVVNEEIFPKQTRTLLHATFERSQNKQVRKEPVVVAANASSQTKSPAKTSSQQATSNINTNNTNQNNGNNNNNQQVEEAEEESEDEEDEECAGSEEAVEYKPESILMEIAEKKVAIKHLMKDKQDVRKSIDGIENKIKEARRDVKASEAKLAIWKKSMTTSFEEWTVTNVILLLKELKMQHVTRIFEENQIDGKALLALTTVDLVDFGLSTKEAKLVQRSVFMIQNHNSLAGGPDVFKWNAEKLHEWLTDNHLPHLVDSFKTQNVTSEDLIFLDRYDIAKWLGVEPLNDKLALESAIEKLKSTVIKKKIPEEFLCPITHEIMKDPVVTSDGNTYERQAIEQWLKRNNTSPLTNAPLANKKVIPNQHLKNTISKFTAENQ